MTRIVETWPAETEELTPPEGEAFLEAELKPNRSLGHPAFAVLMLSIAAMSFVSGMLFISIGAWPVMPFFGLDALLLWLAFRLSYRSGRAREWIRVDARGIEVVRHYPTGHRRRYRLPTAWTRLRLINPGEHHRQLALTAHGRSLILASFLSPPERSDFAHALGQALGRARAAAGAPQEPGGAAGPGG